MKNIKSVNNYAYDDKDIAKSLQRAMSQSADPLAVKYLNDARKSKIEEGGSATAMYKNDELTRAADEYVESFSKTNTDKLSEARRKAQAESLKKAYTGAKRRYERGVSENAQTSANERRLYLADAQKKQIDTEASLARLGLGRGIGSGVSSGFGESARAKLLSDAAEGLNEIYEKERVANNELAEQRDEAMRTAEEAYAKNIDSAYSQQASNMIESDKNYNDMRLSLINMGNQRQESDRDFEYNKNKDERDFDVQQEQNKFDNAMALFDKTGVIENEEQAKALGLPVGSKTSDMQRLAHEIELAKQSFESEAEAQRFERAYQAFAAAGFVTDAQMAQTLGIPVGTKYWQYVTDTIRANASALSASASMKSADASEMNAIANLESLDIDKQRAANETYQAQTDRMRTEDDIKRNRSRYEY